MLRHAALVLLALAFPSGPVQACGPETDCRIGDRTYRIHMPAGHDDMTPVGAIVFAHGYRGTAAGTMRNRSLKKLADDLGVALIATKSSGNDWSIPGVPADMASTGAAEGQYLRAMIEDVSKRFAIDTTRMILTGFSAGGMLVWHMACHESDTFAAFAPMSGTFWDPVPETCTSPAASIMHIHGDADKIVPLGGRPIANTHQGDVPTAIAMYARHGEFGPPAPRPAVEGLRCRRRTNGDGKTLDFCLFSGGHSFRAAYLRHAWEAFEKAGDL